MTIRKESLRILLLNLFNHKLCPRILPIRAIQSRRERSGEAPSTDSSMIITNWVVEGESWRSRGTACSFMDVDGGFGG